MSESESGYLSESISPMSVPTQTAPDPSTWGEVLSDFPKTHCDIGSPSKTKVSLRTSISVVTWPVLVRITRIDRSILEHTRNGLR